jgi:hypothetical protein
VFGELHHEYNPQEKQVSSLKHKATPISVQNLRRSKRNTVVNNGFKPSSPSDGGAKHARKRAPKTSSSAGKKVAAIDRCFSSGLTHPHIPAHEL